MPRSFLVKKLKAEAFPAAGAPAPPYAPLEPPYALPGPAAGDGECGAGDSGWDPPAAIVCAPSGAGGGGRGPGRGSRALCPAAGRRAGVQRAGGVRPSSPCPSLRGHRPLRSWSLGKHPLRDSGSSRGQPPPPPPAPSFPAGVQRAGFCPRQVFWGYEAAGLRGQSGEPAGGAGASPCLRVLLFAAVPRAPPAARLGSSPPRGAESRRGEVGGSPLPATLGAERRAGLAGGRGPWSPLLPGDTRADCGSHPGSAETPDGAAQGPALEERPGERLSRAGRCRVPTARAPRS